MDIEEIKTHQIQIDAAQCTVFGNAFMQRKGKKLGFLSVFCGFRRKLLDDTNKSADGNKQISLPVKQAPV